MASAASSHSLGKKVKKQINIPKNNGLRLQNPRVTKTYKLTQRYKTFGQNIKYKKRIWLVHTNTIKPQKLLRRWQLLTI